METKQIIKEAFEFVTSAFPETSAVVAGGIVADAYFGLAPKDVDVFIGSNELLAYAPFLLDNGFERVSSLQQGLIRMDSYGDPVFGLTDTNAGRGIEGVFKGVFKGYPMDIVFVEGDVINHVSTMFDMSIKSAFYNGQLSFTKAFADTVSTGIITPIRYDKGSYVRAKLAAIKYGLELAPEYTLSKDYCTHSYREGKLKQVISKSTMEKIEDIEKDIFDDEDVDMANVIMMDVFYTHATANQGATEIFNMLTKLSPEKVVVNHRATEMIYNLDIESNDFSDYRFHLRNVLSVKDCVDTTVLYVTANQFLKGVLMDGSFREVRIGKYIVKLTKKFKEDDFPSLYHYRVFLIELEKMKKIFDNRATTHKAKVFITGSKHALTHISTNTEWVTSCQRWDGLGQNTGQNYGLLGNVSGNTLVAYVADERSDNDSSKWKARILVRIGEGDQLFLETPYTTRIAYQGEPLRESLCNELINQGFDVYGTGKGKAQFRGVLGLCKPYNDCASQLMVKRKGIFTRLVGNDVAYQEGCFDPEDDFDGLPF